MVEQALVERLTNEIWSGLPTIDTGPGEGETILTYADLTTIVKGLLTIRAWNTPPIGDEVAEAMIEAAYREGYDDGWSTGTACMEEDRAYDADTDWRRSDTYRAMRAIAQEQS